MDIITQLQEQVNTIASLAFNIFGALQRDALPVQLSPNYPEPPAISAISSAVDDAATLAEQPKLLSSALVKAAKQFDALVSALPLSEGGEEAQLKRIAELQRIGVITHRDLLRPAAVPITGTNNEEDVLFECQLFDKLP